MRRVDSADQRAGSGLRHSAVEDAFGLVSGALLVSLGVFVLQASQTVTGGTAGMALLMGYATGLPFGVLFVGVNVPFFVLGAWQRGWSFTIRSIGAVVLVSALAELHRFGFGDLTLEPLYGAIMGNLLAGTGILILFRHRCSMGGFNILALIAQDRFGLRAGYVQMGLDLAVILASLAVIDPVRVLISAAGAVLLNLVIALNHRPGRYLGY